MPSLTEQKNWMPNDRDTRRSSRKWSRMSRRRLSYFNRTLSRERM